MSKGAKKKVLKKQYDIPLIYRLTFGLDLSSKFLLSFFLEDLYRD
jgi:hypothetical protein